MMMEKPKLVFTEPQKRISSENLVFHVLWSSETTNVKLHIENFISSKLPKTKLKARVKLQAENSIEWIKKELLALRNELNSLDLS